MKPFAKILLLLAGSLAATLPLHAQSNPPFQNPSLDSNCYFPQIGMPGEIDTIYGSHSGEGLGSFIHNLGPNPDGSFGNMLIGSGNASPLGDWSQVRTGPNFNLHNLKARAQTLSLDPQYVRFGHFHDRSHVDIFDEDWWRIYWADNNGGYDSGRYTQLKLNIYGSIGSSRSLFLSPTYISPLANDSVDDIVLAFYTRDSVLTRDSDYLALFKGGTELYEKPVAFEDTSIVVPPPYINDFHSCIQGDFRGTGRDDLIIADNFGSLFFFQHDPPFSLERFVHAILFDTLTAKTSSIRPYQTITMPALPKRSSDRSLDWVIQTSTKDSGNIICVFRGGPDFGSHRITIDSAAYVIAKPKLGETYWPDFICDAGDLTGTQNHVLYVAADDGVNAYQNFYLTGQALDDKIDIYNSFSAGALLDTLVANDDTLGDVLMGLPGYTSDDDLSTGKRHVGSLWLMYGSKQIPVHLNPQFADVKSITQQNGAGITFSPNPVSHGWSVSTIAWPKAERAEYEIYDLLGHAAQSGSIRMLGGAEQYRMFFPSLISGVYEIVIHSPSCEVRAKLVIAR